MYSTVYCLMRNTTDLKVKAQVDTSVLWDNDHRGTRCLTGILTHRLQEAVNRPSETAWTWTAYTGDSTSLRIRTMAPLASYTGYSYSLYHSLPASVHGDISDETRRFSLSKATPGRGRQNRHARANHLHGPYAIRDHYGQHVSASPRSPFRIVASGPWSEQRWC